VYTLQNSFTMYGHPRFPKNALPPCLEDQFLKAFKGQKEGESDLDMVERSLGILNSFFTYDTDYWSSLGHFDFTKG
jgi:hypothetical protein